MSDSLSLARRLSALDDDALTALLVTRQVAPKDLRDFFDLADALLEPASIRLALRSLDRATLAQLAGEAAVTDARPAALALAAPADEPGEAFSAYDGVPDVARTVLAAASSDGAPSASTPPAPTGGGEADAASSAVARERAFVALTAVSELLHQLRLAPVRVRTRGGVSAADEKRLAPLLGVVPDAVGLVAEIARAARLAALDPAASVEMLLPTERLTDWLRLPPGERWLSLATDWVAALDSPTRAALAAGAPAWTAGAPLRTRFEHLFPASDDAMRATLPHTDAVAAFLGLHLDGRTTLFGTLALATAFPRAADPTAGSAPADPATPSTAIAASTAAAPGPAAPAAAAAPTAAAAARIAAELPDEVDHVYLQHDLSVIAPGPLAPAIDAHLRALADIESRGVASGYRITAQTIGRALASGETEQSLRTFLAEVSLTGLPQALDYLLAEGARRHGLVTVRPADPADDRSRFSPPPPPLRTLVRVADPALLGALRVDQTLTALGLTPAGADALASRADPDAVYWSLLDARYPVLALDAAGTELQKRRTRVLPTPLAPGVTPAAPGATAASTPLAPAATATAPPATAAAAALADPVTTLTPSAPAPRVTADLVLRLRAAAAQAPDDATAWISRRLDQAVRARTPIRIDVRLPDGSVTHYDVTPQSFANGRLRCVDVRAGVERTVPAANIVHLETA